MIFDQNQKVDIFDNAQRYGGSFAKALTLALIKADTDNQIKLESQFYDLFEKYLNF